MGNSVIYRPAYDAEVEYLESNDNSYIDTGLKASSELGILAHIYVTGIFPFGGRNGLNNKEFSFCARQQDGYSGFRFGSGGVLAQGERVNELYEFDNTQNHNILKVGNTTYVAPYNSFISDYNVFLFGLNNAGAVNFSSSRIYDFKIYQNSTLVRDYIPVRIGSVGYMYDKVSKQLFANKGTGNFILGNDVSNAVIPQQRCVLYFGNQRSVIYERIYEEYKWLIGDNAAYIDTLILPAFGDELSATFTASSKPTVSNVYILCANDNINATSFTTGGDWYTNNRPQLLISNKPSSSTGTYILWDFNSLSTVIKEYYMFMKLKNGELPDYLFKQDGITISPDWILGTNIITAVPTTSYKIGKGYSTITGLDTLKVRNITINNTNLVPCKLLQSIPAILDGNGIARQVGECGMWDKVSNKFYGNVGSGSFTVCND